MFRTLRRVAVLYALFKDDLDESNMDELAAYKTPPRPRRTDKRARASMAAPDLDERARARVPAAKRTRRDARSGKAEAAALDYSESETEYSRMQPGQVGMQPIVLDLDTSSSDESE